MRRLSTILTWVAVALAGALAFGRLALSRGETINAAWLITAALCTYAVAYRFYSRFIAARIFALDDARPTPAHRLSDGRDYVPTNKWIAFGHHFAAIAGPGPLVGPTLAAQFGYLPGALWIIIGVALGGAVQDMVILCASMRRDGKSLGQMAAEEIGSVTGVIALVAILGIMIILISVLGLVIVNALNASPWGVVTIGLTIPIALIMGIYLRYLRPHRVLEASAIGIVLLIGALFAGQWVAHDPSLAPLFTFSGTTLAFAVMLYGFVASVTPVWLLLAPRDYLSAFVKIGVVVALALGIIIVLPPLQMPALTPFARVGTGPVFAGKLFPFAFITIACGAISGFHALIASGTTPKLINKESDARMIGYGAMLTESLVAIMALVAACLLTPGIYFAINAPASAIGTTVQSAAHAVSSWGFSITPEQLSLLAHQVGETSLLSRTGGAPSLAVGMAQLFSNIIGGDTAKALWYHFAIMFEALFILTTLDAGTRVGRYLLQDFLGHIWKPLGDTKKISANFFASALMVGAWGIFLIQGVRDPLGGINSLWPLFGIANQLLAAIALCLAVTIILKMQLPAGDSSKSLVPGSKGRPVLAWVALLPLLWLLAVTMTAGVQKIWDSNPKIGFLAQIAALKQQVPGLESTLATAKAGNDSQAIQAAEKALRTNRILRFNNALDAAVAGLFLILVGAIFLLSLREWLLLIARKKAADLHETPPTWLPDYALAQAKPLNAVALLALAFALVKELSGEADLHRAHTEACGHCQPHDAAQIYVQTTEQRFNGVKRCC